MATGDYEALLARALDAVGGKPTWESPADLARFGVEALVIQRLGDARALRSFGMIRMHGENVRDHSVDLDAVGGISSLWQRTTTAVGAGLEGFKATRGRVPGDIEARTRLALSAAPEPGSVVLRIEPKSNPLDEAEPRGSRPLIGVARPLADLASEALVSLLATAAATDLDESDALAASLMALGPRAAAAIHELAGMLHSTDIALETSWSEPERPTVRSDLSPAGAKWLARFIEGRDLASEVETFVGVAETVSNRERWLIATDEGLERVTASHLESADVRRVRAGDTVTLRVRVSRKSLPDGTTSAHRDALELLDVSPPDGADIRP